MSSESWHFSQRVSLSCELARNRQQLDWHRAHLHFYTDEYGVLSAVVTLVPRV